MSETPDAKGAPPEAALTRKDLSEELSLTRRELAQSSGLAQRELRENLGRTRQELQEALGRTREELQGALSRTREELVDASSRMRQEAAEASSQTRQELADASSKTRQEFNDALGKTREEFTAALSLTRAELSKKPGMALKDWLQVVVMPLLFAVAGVWYGTYLQDRSFKKNTLFTKQYERLLAAQKEAANLYQDLNKLLYRIESFEELGRSSPTQCTSDYLVFLIEDLKTFKDRGLGLKNYSKGVGTPDALDEKLKAYAELVDATVVCESKFVPDHCQAPCKPVANELRKSLDNVIYAHNDLIAELTSRNK
jgi:hypothetical protein